MQALHICTGVMLLGSLCPLCAQSPASAQNKARAALNSQVGRIGKDCQDAKTTLEITSCIVLVEQKTKSDFADFLDSLHSLLRGDNEAVRQLDISQEQWERYRQTACEAVDSFFRSGTIRLSAVSGCTIQLTRSRMQDLDVLYHATLHN